MGVVVRSAEGGDAAGIIEAALGGVPGSAEGQYVCVGDVIIEDTDEEGFLRGHGTQVLDGKLVATLCGVVERVNKLVFVRPLKTRYDAAQGDVVVGRVTEVAGKRWKVDLASRQEASLLLSAVNLPGGAQRRRNAEDELRMREVFREGDLVSAEVQSVQTDGGVALHTRSLKYGMLVGGQLVQVPPALVKRQKQHFHTLEAIGVDLILGCNGLLWVAPHPPKSAGIDAAHSAGGPAGTGLQGSSAVQQQGAGEAEDAMDEGLVQPPPLSRQRLEVVVRVGNSIRALARSYLAIYPTTIMDTYELALESGTPLKDMLESSFLVQVVRNEALRRHNLLGGTEGAKS